MSFLPAPEVEDLRDHLRKFLDQNAGSAQLRAFIESQDGYDTALWRRAIDETCLTGLAALAPLSGRHAGLLTVGSFLEEFDRSLA